MTDIIELDTPASELPATIRRTCCPGKSCGAVTLTLEVDATVVGGEPVLTYSYKRDNGDDYWYRPVSTVNQLIDRMNDETYWVETTEAAWAKYRASQT